MSAEGRPRRSDALQEPQRLSRQLSTLLAAEIVSGRIGVGEAFPSSEEIVTEYGVSRTVAQETVQALAMLGMDPLPRLDLTRKERPAAAER